MPEISRFLGIIISMYYDDHNPPHFHVRYGDYKAAIKVDDLTVKEGCLPSRVLGLVIEWASLHKNELLDNWTNIKNGIKPQKIEPLV